MPNYKGQRELFTGGFKSQGAKKGTNGILEMYELLKVLEIQ
jgi:hypothetical protein